MTFDIRIECQIRHRQTVVRTTGDDLHFVARKAEKKLAEHQKAGCFGWLPTNDHHFPVTKLKSQE